MYKRLYKGKWKNRDTIYIYIKPKTFSEVIDASFGYALSYWSIILDNFLVNIFK